MVSVVLLLATLTTVPQQSPPPASAVFIVRHAERADSVSAGGAMMMKDDPELSARGHARAKSLAAMLRDAGIRAIYTSELKRTQQTAAPLALAVGARVTSLPADDVAGLIQKVTSETGHVLIVGHSNTIPKILTALGVEGSIEIGDQEFDNLLIVLRGTPARLLRLRFE